VAGSRWASGEPGLAGVLKSSFGSNESSFRRPFDPFDEDEPSLRIEGAGPYLILKVLIICGCKVIGAGPSGAGGGAALPIAVVAAVAPAAAGASSSSALFGHFGLAGGPAGAAAGASAGAAAGKAVAKVEFTSA